MSIRHQPFLLCVKSRDPRNGIYHTMANEYLAVLTTTAQAWQAKARVNGYGLKITRFVVGSNGHDPTNPRLPLTPDPTRSGCYCGNEAITTIDGCLFSDFIDAVTWKTDYCPVYTCRLESGEAVGIVSSVCLIAEVVYSPIPADPVVGTEFLYAILNLPYRPKIAGEVVVIDIAVPTKL